MASIRLLSSPTTSISACTVFVKMQFLHVKSALRQCDSCEKAFTALNTTLFAPFFVNSAWGPGYSTARVVPTIGKTPIVRQSL